MWCVDVVLVQIALCYRQRWHFYPQHLGSQAADGAICWGQPAKNVRGGPGFEPGASRSRTGTTVCPSISRRFLPCPPVLNRRDRRVLSSPPVPPGSELRDTAVTSPHDSKPAVSRRVDLIF